MKLHSYQKANLDTLSDFFDKISEESLKQVSPKAAFVEITERNYLPAHGMPEEMPYVCIRVPTGGGKTLMAAHAVGIAADRYLKTETPVCLWLAPSKTIVSQTLKSLQDREHPCYRALADAFSGDINCMTIADALRINKHDMDGGITVIVATIQSFNVEKTEGRKVYDDNGNLMEHFDSVPSVLRDKLHENEDGEFFHSLANAIQLRRPIVISDEAHNASTKTFYESLARFNPSCIIEFTATPQIENKPKQKIYASNVLCQSSGRNLKVAGMVKLPINLEVRNNWRESIRATIAKREKLEKVAKKLDNEYIRPIALYQAENVAGEATAEVVRNALIDDFKIPAEQIAEHTGTTRELQNVDLFSRDCPIRHIITVKALAEGWDCSFAYVLCSMANFQSGRPVEQVLGRILRMPRATPKNITELNECYTFSGGNFYKVAASLQDALIKGNGFQKLEVSDFIAAPPGYDKPGSLFGDRVNASKKLPKDIKPLIVPLLAVRESGKLEFFDSVHFLDAQWSIARERPKVVFYPPSTVRGKGEINVSDGGRVGMKKSEPPKEIKPHEQLMLLESDKKWTDATLAAWMDEKISHPDIPQTQSSPYILAAVKKLIEKHGLNKLTRWRFYVKTAIEKAIDELRRKKRAQGYQRLLRNMPINNGKLEVSAECALTFERHRYELHEECPNSDVFGKHLFSVVGDMKGHGEEYECACHLDSLSEIEVWVRNIERKGGSFWLQTSTDKFYPDFVCRLTDGRILVVEYKGENLWSNDDSKEKRAIGQMWAKQSKGKCLFVMPKGMDWDAISKQIKGDKPRK